MPEFLPGESKTAIAPMSNPTVKAFDYTGFIYMGTDLAVMSQVDFHLEAGEEKNISLPVTMPLGVGTYPVYIGVFSGGKNIGLYRATEDVTITTKAVISGATWELIDYPFVGDWPEETGPLHATFCKGTLQVESASEFVGSVQITCPNTIAPVPLLTAYGYQQLLAEIDDKIATSTGAIKELWQNRKAITTTFPKVDEFTIDYRWWADFDAQFRTWINASPVAVFTLDNVLIPAGTSIVEIGFFVKYGAAVGLFPATVSLYSDETLIGSVTSDLVPPTNVPQLLGVTIPSAVSGGEVPLTMVLRLPKNRTSYYWKLWLDTGVYETCELAKADYGAASIAIPLMDPDRCGRTVLIPLNAPDNIYTIYGIWNDYEWVVPKAELYNRRTGLRTPLPPGVYSVRLTGESWRIGAKPTGCGYYIYGLTAEAEYDFGIVGYLEVT